MLRPRSLAWLTILGSVALISGDARAATGGPDAFGYTFFDQADGAVYSFVDITLSGAQFQPFGDDALGPLTLAAPFAYYGQSFTDLDVSTNGFVTLSAATNSDLGNSCPLPDVDATHPRMEVLHDDLETRIFYQYFDQAGAAAVGYPGEAAGISVIQWTGDHFPDSPPDNVNFEVILFHGSGELLMMVAADPETGSGSTIGTSDPGTGAALTYGCNVAGVIQPGVTAIRFVPPTPSCGNGFLEAGEECDDAGESATCDSDCSAASCGDGTINAAAAEECDDAGESATCDADCTAASCGDGTINGTAGEACDDAGESATCDADCTPVSCGDGTFNVTAGEECDDGGESVTCDADCTAASCGDTTVNAAAGEECDDAGESATCDADCTAATCGDTTVNTTAGETCDEGGVRTATCNTNCTAATCGDGVLNATAGEECDGDGAGTPGETATCDPDCTAAMCGDGLLNTSAGEECDGDGAGTPGETATCDDDCTAAACGDGVVNASAGEECDDRNERPGDGCDAECVEEMEPGGSSGTDDGASESGGGSEDDTGTSADGTGGPDTGASADDTGASADGTGASADGTGGPVPPPIDGSTGEETTGDTDGAAAGDDGGCSCSTDEDRQSGAAWSVLGLLALVNLRRRRRHA